MAKQLEGLLVLTPTLRGLDYLTEVTIDALTEAGARKCRSNGNSDVGMHRCQVAARAAKLLEQHPDLHTILWLDGDMVATVDTVAALVQLTNMVAACRPLPEDGGVGEDVVDQWRRTMAPAVSGAYVKRNDPKHYALRQVYPPIPPLTVTTELADGSLEVRQLPAIVSGMGCLCQTREAFLAHVAEAPIMGEGDENAFPAITGSGPGRATDGATAWGSEDWVYTSWEWQRERGVYLAQHLHFGHAGQVVFWPQPDTELEV